MSSVTLSAREAAEPASFLDRNKDAIALFQAGVGFALIMATVWTRGAMQRRLFWISASYFLAWGLIALGTKIRNDQKLRSLLPSLPLAFSLTLILGAMIVAGMMLAVARAEGTLHGLFGVRDPLLHAAGYVLWAVIQQLIQQTFFFSRFEQLVQRGLLASFIVATLFAVAHIPNPVLTPVTFVGGWILSELYRRFRTVLPLGLAHGMIGIAIACSVPDRFQHHMRVGLGYLTYAR